MNMEQLKPYESDANFERADFLAIALAMKKDTPLVSEHFTIVITEVIEHAQQLKTR